MQITELEVWQSAMDLAQRLYKVASTLPEADSHGLAYYLRQAAVKIPSHIAAAASRKYGNESIRALNEAKEYLYQSETILRLAHKMEMLTEEELNHILEQLETSRKLLFGFLKYYKRATRSS